jgi:hypothetical protein
LTVAIQMCDKTQRRTVRTHRQLSFDGRIARRPRKRGVDSVLCEAAEEWDGLDQKLLLFGGELTCDRVCEPAFAAGAVLGKDGPAAFADADQGLAAVDRIRGAVDERACFELADRVGHRLRPDALGGCEGARGCGTVTVKPVEDRRLGDREPVLGAEPPHELAEHDRQLARSTSRFRPPSHRPSIQVICTVFL